MTYADMISLYQGRAMRRHKKRVAAIVERHPAVFAAMSQGQTLEGSPLMAEAENVLFLVQSCATGG